MVSWSLLAEHGLAFALVWACVGVAGAVFLSWFRIGIGLVSTPLVGVVYWTLALYLLPFSGGLDVAAGAVLMLGAIQVYLRYGQGQWNPIWKRFSWGTLVLVTGSLPYVTTLLYDYVPFGMDGSMHTTGAALIGRAHGLPANYSPYAADVSFPAVNLGLPAVAGMAIAFGGEPAAVMLATHHLTFTCLILSTYVLLRWWTHRTSAAVLAVASVWMARASQSTLGWGGFPTVLSIAVGVFAARLLIQHARMPSWRLSLATGAAIAAVPLVHGIGGGTWIYCAGTWISLAALATSPRKIATLRGLVTAGAWAGAVLVIYGMSQRLELQPSDMENTRDFVRQNAPAQNGIQAWLEAWSYAHKNSGNVLVSLGLSTCILLALCRQWGAASLLSGAWISLATVVANARWYVLPASFLLYPERVLYWSGPLAAVGLALVWRTLPASSRESRLALVAALGLLGMAGYFQNQFYQKMVREMAADGDGWEALVWARGHLQPERHFVIAPYNSPGAFLPAIAQIACSGSHHHHFIARQILEAYGRRQGTHQLVEISENATESVAGKIVFENRRYRIVEFPHSSQTRGR